VLTAVLLCVAGGMVSAQVPAGDTPSEPTNADLLRAIEQLRQEVAELRRNDSEKSRTIAELKQQMVTIEQRSKVNTVSSAAHETLPAAPAQPPGKAESALDRALRESAAPQKAPAAGPESPLDQALRGLGPGPTAPSMPLPQQGTLQLIDISLDGLFAAGSSTERDESLQTLQAGGHDPRKRGFTVQNIELSVLGAVDPYLDGEAHIIYFLDPLEGETIVELEECFFTTRSLPYGLQLEGGTFFTEFGRINPNHPHAWLWQDQPIINSRLFGADGMRGPGVRLGWLLPVQWFSQVHVGVQNANGETTTSFLANDEVFTERPVGGRPFVERDVRSLQDMIYLARWENSWNTHADEVTWLVGTSALFGPNATGRDGVTEIYGADLKVRWRPALNQRGWPFVVLESEIMHRDYTADDFVSLGDPLDPLDDMLLGGSGLRDWGFYSQVLYGWKPRWAAGIRYEYANGAGDSLDEELRAAGRGGDAFRDNRHRLSPLVAWYPTEFSRFRFQYNFDYAEHIRGKDAHSFWLGAEFLFGAHPAHKF
jgi:hypothetical protein